MVDVERLTPDHWPVWRSVRLMALEEAPRAFGSTLADWTGSGDTEDRWRGRLEDVPANFVAYVDGSPVGQASGAPTENRGIVELISLWVAPEARGSGVGHELIAAVLRWALAARAASVVLWVRVDNDPAIALYEREGFVRTPAEVEDGECEMVLSFGRIARLEGAARQITRSHRARIRM